MQLARVTSVTVLFMESLKITSVSIYDVKVQFC